MRIIYVLLVIGTGVGLCGAADLALAGHLLEAVSQLGLALICGWCGFVFARRAPRATTLPFVGYSLALSLEIAGHMNSGRSPQSVWVWVFFCFALACGPLFLDLVTRFPLPRPDMRWVVLLAWGLVAGVGVLGPLGLLGPVFNPMHPLAVAARELHYRGGGHSIYAISSVAVYAGMQAIAVGVLWSTRQKARREANARAARQALILILGVLLSWVPVVPFLPDVLPAGMELVFHGPTALFIGLGPLACVAALVLPEFHDDRGLFRHVLIGMTLMSGAFLLYLALVRPLTLLLDQVQPGFGREPAIFGTAIVVALLTRPIQTWVTNQIDRLFFPHLLGFRTLLQETSQALATTIIPREVAKLATDRLPGRLGTSGAVLLVLDDLEEHLISLSGPQYSLSPDHPVWVQATRANDPTLLRDVAHCTDLDLTAPALMLPLRVGGRLVGIYVLGARYSAIAYSRDELSQLKVLGHHLAVAVANGRALRKIDALSQRALAEVEERNRIAREIHDTLAQGLTAASLQLDVVQATITANPARAEKAAERAQSIVRSNLAEARRSVLELRAPLLGTESLPAALSQLLSQAASDIGAAGTFRIEGTYRAMPARVENQLYRIAQEALHNAVKYSSASHLTVTLRADSEQVALSIADDGAGFDPERPVEGTARGGFGLTGMGERARLLGGRLHIQSEPGEGTLIETIVPLRNREGGPE